MTFNELPVEVGIPIINEEGELESYKPATVILIRNFSFEDKDGNSMEGTQVISYDKDGKIYGHSIEEIKIIKTRKYEEREIRPERGGTAKTKRRRPKNRKRNNNSGNKEGNQVEGASDSRGNGNKGNADGGKTG